MGVSSETPQTWAELRWVLYGDGRTFVSPSVRAVLMARLLEETPDASPLGTGDGTVEVLCQLAQQGLPWLPGSSSKDLTSGETRAVELVRAYGEVLRGRGLVEPAEVLACLPEAMAREGFSFPPCVFAGFSEMDRATREFACALAAQTEAWVVVPAPQGPEGDLARDSARKLEADARRRGVAVEVGRDAASWSSERRAPELGRLLGSLFRPEQAAAVMPSGAVRLLEPAGPLAVSEVACRRVRELADEGATRVLVVAPDVAAAWASLAPKLHARGLSVSAQLTRPVLETRVGAGLLRYTRDLARLSELDAVWPADAAETLPDMSWWPPRDLADFLMSSVAGLPVERAWSRDAGWRGNRILTPRSVIDALLNSSATSPAFAAATRELLQGHLAAAAGKLLLARTQTDEPAGAEGASTGDAGTAGEPASVAAPSPDATDEPAPGPLSAEEALAEAEAASALAALAEAGRALREAGVSVGDEGVGLSRFAELARTAVGRLRVTCRPRLIAEDATCEVSIAGAHDVSGLAPASYDAVVYLGLDAGSAPIPASDGALEELLAHAGIDTRADGLVRARHDFASVVRLAASELDLVRPARDERAQETFPAVMLSEVVSCYATRTDEQGDEVPLLVPDAASRRDEGLVEENLAASGSRPRTRLVPGAAPAGRLDEALRRFVVVPRDGQAELPEGRPSLSASQIESYLECPFKWFTLRRLGLDDCDAGFSNMEMGTFAHRVLEVTHRELMLEAAAKAGLVGEDCGEAPGEGKLFWFDPAERVVGSRVDAATLGHATELLRAEFAEHLAHQRLDGSKRSKQALIPHDHSEQRRLATLEADLVDTLSFESTRLAGFEPRLFEGRFGGSSGLQATYAGADLVGTIDRIDVDAEGRALVIDYKHKSSLFEEYALSPKGGPAWADGGTNEFRLPRRVQTLIYASVARGLLKGEGIEVVGALYLGTKGNHQLAGAVSARDVDAVWGPDGLRERDLDRVVVPVPGARNFDELLDRTEEAIAGAIDQMRAGVIDARPCAPDACAWCPVLDCERRLS